MMSQKFIFNNVYIVKGGDKYIRLSRCSTARGFGTGLSLVGLTKVKARKSFLFSESSLRV